MIKRLEEENNKKLQEIKLEKEISNLQIKQPKVNSIINLEISKKIFSTEGQLFNYDTKKDKAIELNPNFIDAYFQRGYCFYNLKKYQKAMVEMNKVLELDPNYYQAYYEKGFCFQKMKKV